MKYKFQECENIIPEGLQQLHSEGILRCTKHSEVSRMTATPQISQVNSFFFRHSSNSAASFCN